MDRPIVAYCRVSTARQGRSGLGLEAQREAVARFAAAEGLVVAREFTEIETGKARMPWTDARSLPPHWRRPDAASALSW